MRLVLQSFLSLDGVYQGPGAPDEDVTGGFERGGWLVPFVDASFEAAMAGWITTASGFLFGRRTYDAFASVWPTITDGADGIAALLNGKPKYVVTSRDGGLDWGPVRALTGDVLPAVAALKAEGEGEVQIHGSGQLGGALLAAGLVDELRLAVAPVVLGQGRRLFSESPAALRLSPLSHTVTDKGVTVARYACEGRHKGGSYTRGQTPSLEG